MGGRFGGVVGMDKGAVEARAMLHLGSPNPARPLIAPSRIRACGGFGTSVRGSRQGWTPPPPILSDKIGLVHPYGKINLK